MSREEIREGIKEVLYQMNTEVMLASGRDYGYYVDKIIFKLRSQGVVIKGETLGFSHPHLAEYYTIESLIKEV